jgi:hypothetical protein
LKDSRIGKSNQNYNYQTSFNTFDISHDFVKAKNPAKEQKIAFDTAYKNYVKRCKNSC